MLYSETVSKNKKERGKGRRDETQKEKKEEGREGGRKLKE
jgi:hypothetical protein